MSLRAQATINLPIHGNLFLFSSSYTRTMRKRSHSERATFNLIQSRIVSLMKARVFCLFLFLLALAVFQPQRSFAITTNVTYASFFYNPTVVVIHPGDTVNFTRTDTSPHTVTGTGSDPICGSSAVTSCSHTFNTVGNFPYQCLTPGHASSGMTGLVMVVAIANTSPTVSITSPASNSVFAANATITINANASDSDGSVSNVSFFVGANLISTDTASPYSAVTNLSAGNYTLSAVVTDNLGAKATNSVPITVNAAPTIALSPAGPFNVNENSALNFNVVGTDSDSLTITSTNLPSGATLTGSGNSRAFSWTPNYGQSYASPYTVSFSASDGINSAVTTNASITVNPVFTPIAISSFTKFSNQVQFHVSGLRLTRTNFVHATTNLSTNQALWSAIKTNIANSTAFDFTDTNVVTTKYYRVLESR